MIEGVLVVVVLIAFGSTERIWAALALVWLVIAAYEAATVILFGRTPGKAVSGLRVVALDEVDGVPAAAALRRGAVIGALAAVPVVGWAVWASSTFTDALTRGVADRAAGTMVVPTAAELPIATHDLPGYADWVRRPRMTPLGRVGDLDVRARARLRRLNDAPMLALAIGLLALAVSLPVSTQAVVLISSAIWIVVFVADEAWRVHRHGATAGHRLAGLVVRDVRTGQPPARARSFFRAVVLGTTLYIPVLWPLLIITVCLIRWGGSGRGLHDLAGRTVVVGDPTLDPEDQRQRAMRMRVGQAV